MLTRHQAPAATMPNVPDQPSRPPTEQANHLNLTHHRLTSDEFNAIASGRGDLAVLRAGQLSRRMLLVQALAGAVAERRPDLAKLAEIDDSLALLRGTHRSHRAVVDRLLLHPQIGIWGMRCLRSLYGHGAAADSRDGQWLLAGRDGLTDLDDEALAAQVGCFGTLSATAAMLAGRACDVVAHTLDGGLMFPTLGRATIPAASDWVRIRVDVLGGARSSAGARDERGRRRPLPDGPSASPWLVSLSVLSHEEAPHLLARFELRLDAATGVSTGGAPAHAGVRVVHRASHLARRETRGASEGGGAAGPVWLPLRVLVSEVDGRRLTVDLDDLDPLRAFHHVPPTPRLGDDELAVWARRLDEAWALLVRHHPDRSEAVASALATFIPLRSPGDAEELSASCADAFGAVALTLPHSGLALAASLVHELAHSRLSALLDLVPLFEPDRRAVHYSPWRRDPRPVPGLTQGAFAFLALTGFWNDHKREADGAGRRLAQFEYARWSVELAGVLDTLANSGTLTGLGEQFVAGMGDGLAAIRRDPGPEDGESEDGVTGSGVPAEVARLADLATADHRITWRLRNIRPRASLVDVLSEAWHARRACPPLPPSAVGSGTDPAAGSSRAVAGPSAPDDLAPSAPRFASHGRLSLTYLRLREPARFDELAGAPGGLGVAVPAASPADLLLLTGQGAAAARRYQELIVERPDRIELWAGLALARRATRGDEDPLVRRPEVALALYTRLNAEGAAPGADVLADWLAGAATDSAAARPAATADARHSGDGSNTKSTRRPSITSRTSGWPSRSTRR